MGEQEISRSIMNHKIVSKPWTGLVKTKFTYCQGTSFVAVNLNGILSASSKVVQPAFRLWVSIRSTAFGRAEWLSGERPI
jgi:hypothetical protein